MITLTLMELCTTLDAQLVGADTIIQTVSTDSRSISEGGLFIALRGDRFDAHEFIDETLCHKASAMLVEHLMPYDIPQLIVKNTRVALGKLASYVREQVNIKAVAITGSNGKTSVKEMVASILSEHHSVLYTAGNFNNDIGVPLTLLRLEPCHQFGVFELGANHKGEIDYTSSLVKPDVALVNNIGAAHLEGFGDISDVASAKSEIFNHLNTSGRAVINVDDDFADFLRERVGSHQIMTFGLSSSADVYATEVKSNPLGQHQFRLHVEQHDQAIKLNVSGHHQILNALAAAAISVALDVPFDSIKSGLEKLQPVYRRMQPYTLGRLLLVDDSYNANPSSVKAAMAWLSEREGVTIFVLGELAELGEQADTMLSELGEYANQLNISHTLTLGHRNTLFSELSNGQHFQELSELMKYLQTMIVSHQGSINVLVKGSRSAAMERVVDALIALNHSGELN